MKLGKVIFLILFLLSLTIVLGTSIPLIEDVDRYSDKDSKKFEQTRNNGVISTGNMPADTMEERAEMRKLTAMADYQPER